MSKGRKSITARGLGAVALGGVALALALTGMQFATAQTPDHVCPRLDSGKIDTKDDPQFVVIPNSNAALPAGSVIVRYCFKAGRGNTFVDVNPGQEELTIRDPGGKDISHYSFAWAVAPTPTPTPTPSPTETPTESPSPTETPTESPSPTETPTESPSPTETPTESPSPSPTETPTESPSPSPTETPTESPTPSPTLPPPPGPAGTPDPAPDAQVEPASPVEDNTPIDDSAPVEIADPGALPVEDDGVAVQPASPLPGQALVPTQVPAGGGASSRNR